MSTICSDVTAWEWRHTDDVISSWQTTVPAIPRLTDWLPGLSQQTSRHDRDVTFGHKYDNLGTLTIKMYFKLAEKSWIVQSDDNLVQLGPESNSMLQGWRYYV